MAYSERAKALRRCKAHKRDGTPCRAWACWNDPLQRCMAHAGRHHRGSMRDKAPYWPRGPKYKPCRCAAYEWPHRPAHGLCRWPDPPIYRCTTPAGTHSEPRTDRYNAMWRMLNRWAYTGIWDKSKLPAFMRDVEAPKNVRF